ncbi:MAG: hypothetical protein JSW11_09120 [Candidatus Heimdallarchaeota archaeon]|nr:MAG: hypothetical protein JSW11_09120 [Candidatus Heimdallarchaeota archaeon]
MRKLVEGIISTAGIRRALGVDPLDFPKFAIIYYIGKRIPPLFGFVDSSNSFGTFFEGRIGNVNGVRIAVIGNTRLTGYHENLLVPLLNTPVEYVLTIGLGGAIASNFEIGDLVIPSASVRGDGLTYYYLSEKIPAVGSLEVLAKIYNTCIEKGIVPHTGVFYTTESKYKELEMFSKLKQDGLIMIEKEVAPIYGLAHAFRKKAGALHIVSDRVSMNDFPSEGFSYESIEERVNIASEIILSTVCDLDKQREQKQKKKKKITIN